jgi:hypothetical protein
MPLPAWMRSQLDAAQAADEPADTTWSVYLTTGQGLVETAGAHDREHAQRFLDDSGRTGIVALGPGHQRR